MVEIPVGARVRLERGYYNCFLTDGTGYHGTTRFFPREGTRLVGTIVENLSGLYKVKPDGEEWTLYATSGRFTGVECDSEEAFDKLIVSQAPRCRFCKYWNGEPEDATARFCDMKEEYTCPGDWCVKWQEAV